MQGWSAPHTSTSSPSNRKAAFWRRTFASARGSSWLSRLVRGGVPSTGIGSEPESQTMMPDPSHG
jgi:hypothetical protein